MMPVSREAVGRVLSMEAASHRSVAIRHAAIHDRPALWGDDPGRPDSVIWLRSGDEAQCEAFASGRPGPAIDWLVAEARGRPIALLAPPEWEDAIRSKVVRFESRLVETWFRPVALVLPSTSVQVRRLTLDDGPAFEAAAPAWALRSWGEFSTLIDRGAAFGVPTGEGFASLAWTFESDHEHDKIGVATVDRFRKLGLARAAVSSLVDHVLVKRHRSPLWVTNPGNEASLGLARSLGFATLMVETLLLLR